MSRDLDAPAEPNDPAPRQVSFHALSSGTHPSTSSSSPNLSRRNTVLSNVSSAGLSRRKSKGQISTSVSPKRKAKPKRASSAKSPSKSPSLSRKRSTSPKVPSSRKNSKVSVKSGKSQSRSPSPSISRRSSKVKTPKGKDAKKTPEQEKDVKRENSPEKVSKSPQRLVKSRSDSFHVGDSQSPQNIPKSLTISVHEEGQTEKRLDLLLVPNSEPPSPLQKSPSSVDPGSEGSDKAQISPRYVTVEQVPTKEIHGKRMSPHFSEKQGSISGRTTPSVVEIYASSPDLPLTDSLFPPEVSRQRSKSLDSRSRPSSPYLSPHRGAQSLPRALRSPLPTRPVARRHYSDMEVLAQQV